jgi:hypothetical protein
MAMTVEDVNRNLLVGIFSIPTIPTKKRKTRFNTLANRLANKGFELERSGKREYPYEIFSNEKEPGVERICQNLDEVEQEVMQIERKF